MTLACSGELRPVALVIKGQWGAGRDVGFAGTRLRLISGSPQQSALESPEWTLRRESQR